MEVCCGYKLCGPFEGTDWAWVCVAAAAKCYQKNESREEMTRAEGRRRDDVFQDSGQASVTKSVGGQKWRIAELSQQVWSATASSRQSVSTMQCQQMWNHRQPGQGKRVRVRNSRTWALASLKWPSFWSLLFPRVALFLVYMDAYTVVILWRSALQNRSGRWGWRVFLIAGCLSTLAVWVVISGALPTPEFGAPGPLA